MFFTTPAHDHCVYQLLSRDGRVIYIGSSSAVFARLGQHAKTKDWWSQVAGVEVESFTSRDEMLEREQVLIEMINPAYNDVYGTASALAFASDLMGRAVTRDEIRAFTLAALRGAAPIESEPTMLIEPPNLAHISLRRYAEETQVPLQALRDWSNRRPDFPVEVAVGANRTKLYDRDHLKAFVAARLRADVTADE
jgi:hypothetical protein